MKPVLLLAAALFVLACGTGFSTVELRNESADRISAVEVLLLTSLGNRSLEMNPVDGGGHASLRLPRDFSEATVIVRGLVLGQPFEAECGYVESANYRLVVVVESPESANCAVEFYV